MPPKKSTKKIADVTSPGRVTPSASSRPIVVTNRPVLTNDPMMVADGAKEPAQVQPGDQLVNRTAKTIRPISSDLQTTEVEKPKTPEPSTPALVAPAAAPVVPTVEPEPTKVATTIPIQTAAPELQSDKSVAVEVAPEPAVENKQTPATETQPAPTIEPEAVPEPIPAEGSTVDDVKTDDTPRDSEAEMTADEIAAAEAKAAREQELELLITSGKYVVPINAVQRKRSRMHTMLLVLLAVVLALLLVDAVLDAGLVSLPINLPHTHIFSGN